MQRSMSLLFITSFAAVFLHHDGLCHLKCDIAEESLGIEIP